MNSMLIGFVLYFVLIGFLIAIDTLDCLPNLADKLRKSLFYSFILQILTESYAMIAVCCMISLTNLHFGLPIDGNTVQTASCLLALAVLVIYPPLVWWILTRSWTRVDFDEVQHRFEPIFEDLRTTIGPVALAHPMYFLLRRLIMAVNVVFLKDHLIFQVILKDFTILAGAIITGFIQYDSRAKRNTELFNEVIVMCVLYCMMCFSPFVPDLEAKQLMGYFLCSLVSAHLAFNLYLILGTSVRAVILSARFWLARLRLRRQRELNAERILSRKRNRREAMADPEFFENNVLSEE